MEQVQRVEALNRRLFELEVNMRPLFETGKQSRLAALHGRYPQLPPFEDFNKEAEIQLYLSKDDPDYTPDDEIILGRRSISLTHSNPFWADGQDHRVDYRPELSRQGIGSACWLFYEFYDRSDEPFQKALSLTDMARVGMIYLEIRTTDQLALHVD